MIPTLALELAPRRIRVNAVGPGFTDTPMLAANGTGSDEVTAMLAAMAAKNPFGRLGKPRDIAESVAFLGSDVAAYITAQEIVESGGAGLGGGARSGPGVARRRAGRARDCGTADSGGRL
jgi:NAD(P)-dependent dehydrogenase (short-subunit alcohol dehydrogenase family)